MKKILPIYLSLIFVLTGCSSLSSLKFWGSDEEEIEKPSELYEIESTTSIEIKWKKKAGDYLSDGRIIPSIEGDVLYHGASDGSITSFSSVDGKEIWSNNLNHSISGSIESGFRNLFDGTLDGQVVSLNQKDGSLNWISKVTSEVLAPPVTDGRIVAVQSADGSITGFNFRTGEQEWIHQVSVPNLSLRGTSIPFISEGFIFTGFSTGNVAMLYPDSGAVRLELPVSVNEGTSELDRITDIDGRGVVANNFLVSATYQGHIMSIDLRSGRQAWKEEVSTTKDLVESRSRIVVIEDTDNVKAFGLSTGAILWEQSGLKLRQLSSPVESRGRVAMGDFEGYLHILDSKDGKFIGRKKISNKPIKELSSSGNDIIALDSSGRLFFLSLR